MVASVTENLARVREQIARAAEEAGRRPDEITLIAVTKRQPVDALRAAIAAGVADVGESYVQEAGAKRESLTASENGAARWHLIGHLQRNKAARAVALFDCIQSLDSLKLAEALAREAAAVGKVLPVLLQVHLGNEETKSGLPPEITLDTAAQVAGLGALRLEGLMGIAPLDADPRPHFAALRKLFERLPAQNRQTLSMGMSGDYAAAITEGATMVRIGTSLFGPRE